MSATHGPWKPELQILCDGLDEKGVMINPRTIKDYFSIRAGEGFWREEDNSKGFCITGYLSESNAQLIAAAPDLLDVCKSIQSEYTSFNHRLSDENINKLISAINKAEGK
jgi:hypothetical protein